LLAARLADFCFIAGSEFCTLSISLKLKEAHHCVVSKSTCPLLQVARLPKFQTLSRELLLEILAALAEEMSDMKLCQDMSSISLSSES
jgi:hypothetical protein